MKRVRMFWLCLTAAFVVSVVGTAAASAGVAEWTHNGARLKKGQTESFTFEALTPAEITATEGGVTFVCPTWSGAGTVVAGKQPTTELSANEMTECTVKGHPECEVENGEGAGTAIQLFDGARPANIFRKIWNWIKSHFTPDVNPNFQHPGQSEATGTVEFGIAKPFVVTSCGEEGKYELTGRADSHGPVENELEFPQKPLPASTLTINGKPAVLQGTVAIELAHGGTLGVVEAKGGKPVIALGTAKEGALPAGSALQAASTNLVLTTSAGNVECASTLANGTLASNESTKADDGSFTSESFSGGEEGLCKTTLPLGPARVQGGQLPWPFELTTKGTGTIKGTKKVAFSAAFPEAGGASCTFEASKLAYTFGQPGPFEPTLSQQVLKLNAHTSNAACPKEGKLSGSFTVSSGGETVEAELEV